MSTLNSGGRRSIDGPVRRRLSAKDNHLSNNTEELPDINSEVVESPVAVAEEAVSVAPEEPIFVYHKARKPGLGLKWMRTLAVGVLVVGVAAGGWFGYKAVSAAHTIIARSNGGAPALTAKKLDLSQLKNEGDGRINILILGIGGQGHEAPNLSDTIMVMSVDPQTKDAAMLSIPRDLYVKIPATARTGVQYGKINAANAYGGPELAAQVVSNVIGVPIHYYVLLDFSGFRQAVDAVGGVDINVATALYDSTYPCDDERGGFCPLSIAAGLQHMNGTIALRYSRSRHSTSDFDRAARQQQVIVALRQKSLQLSTLTNPVKLTGLIDAVGSHVKTDLQPTELTKMAALMKDIDLAKMPQKVLDTSSAEALLNGGINIIPAAGYIEVPKAGTFDYSEIQNLVKNLFSDHYVIQENARVEVQNGSGVAGLGGVVATSLKAAHYNVGDPVNASSHYGATMIYDYTGGKKPYTINYLEHRFGVKAQKATAPTPTVGAGGVAVPAPEIRIILGSDYKSARTSG